MSYKISDLRGKYWALWMLLSNCKLESLMKLELMIGDALLAAFGHSLHER